MQPATILEACGRGSRFANARRTCDSLVCGLLGVRIVDNITDLGVFQHNCQLWVRGQGSHHRLVQPTES